jgi:hypothetical protein
MQTTYRTRSPLVRNVTTMCLALPETRDAVLKVAELACSFGDADSALTPSMSTAVQPRAIFPERKVINMCRSSLQRKLFRLRV